MKKLLLFVLMVIAISVPLFAQGTIVPTTPFPWTWVRRGSPYYVVGNITVPQSYRLVIEAGVEVIFLGDYKITVNGTLRVLGAENDSVSFRADSNSTWSGISFIDGANDSIIKYTKFSDVRNSEVIRVYKTDNLFIQTSLFSGNATTVYIPTVDASILYVYGCEKFSFEKNKVTSNTGFQSTSLIRISRSKNVSFNHNIISENHGAAHMAYFYFWNPNIGDSSIINVKSNQILDNTTTRSVFYVANYQFNNRFYIEKNNISRNTLTAMTNSACAYLHGGDIIFYDNVIGDNHGAAAGGGLGVSALFGNVTINANTINDNSAGQGGGAYIQASIGKGNTTLSFVNNEVYNNVATSDVGGVHLYASPEVAISFANNNIYDNTAAYEAGGVRIGGGNTIVPLSFVNNNIYSNTAVKGGGLFVCDSIVEVEGNFQLSPEIYFYRNTIVHNSADFGAGIYVNNCDIALINNVIAYNNGRGDYPGYGLYLHREQPVDDDTLSKYTILINDILWENGDLGIYREPSDRNDYLYIGNTTIQDGLDSVFFEGSVRAYGLYTADPQFANPTANGWHIQNPDYATLYPGFGVPFNDYLGVIPYDLLSLNHERSISADYQWISFPILDRDAVLNEGVSFDSVAETFFDNATEWKYQDLVTSYDTTFDIWDIQLPDIKSTMGFIIEVQSEFTHSIQGTILNPTTSISLERGVENWVGYFLLETQLVFDTIGDYVELQATYIKTKDGGLYFYVAIDSLGYLTGPGYSTPGITIGFGEMLIIATVPGGVPINFAWHPGPSIPPFVRIPPTYFTFAKKADYQSLFVEYESEDPPTEIGAFINGVCKGAVVYQDTMSEILLYLDESDFDEEIEIVFAYNNGGVFSAETMDKYAVVNVKNQQLEYKTLIAQSDALLYHIKFIGSKGKAKDITPPFVQLLQNYPNPFNPDTKIDFYLSHDDNVTLSVYNIKGQKVCDLLHGATPAGKHSVVWNGKDSIGHTVSSGVYLYKLTTGLGSVQRKMVLLK